MSIGEQFESTDCHRVTYGRSLCWPYLALAPVIRFLWISMLLCDADQNDFFSWYKVFEKCEFKKKENYRNVREFFCVDCRSFVALTQGRDTKTFLDKTFLNPSRQTFED